MLVETGSIIPKGYMVKITSWENDGDDYRTVVSSGLTLEQAHFLKELAEKFDSSLFGNKEYDSQIVSIMKELAADKGDELEDLIGFDINEIEEPEFGYKDIEVLHFLYDHILHEPIGYESWFCRAVEYIEVFHLDTDFVVPSFEPEKVEI